MLPIIAIIAISGGNTASIISITSVVVSTMTSTTTAIACGVTATATVISGGIIYTIYSLKQEEKNEAEQNLNQLPFNRIETTNLLEQIPRFYPITTFVNDDEKSILFFNNDTTSHEQRFECLKQNLEKFSDQIKKFENSLKNDHKKVEEFELKFTAQIVLKGLEICSQKLKLAPSENENHKSTLHSIILEFNSLLQKLSTTVSQTRIKTSAFSLAHQIHLIQQTYHHLPNKGSITLFASDGSKAFEEDMNFIRDVSDHPKCTDDIRIASLKILKNKNESYLLGSNQKTDELINFSLQYSKNNYDDNAYCQLFADFCHETENIIPPDQLQSYLNQNKRNRISTSI